MDIIKDFMSTPVLRVNADASIEEAAKEMEEKQVNCLIVKAKEESVGIITTSDVVKRVVAKGLDPKTTKVDFIMSKPLITINHYLTRSDANEMMLRKKIKHIAVTDGSNILGILTSKDMTT
jgi:signal-transduction protein with cAMP-binding, CBS, and nucleotidyltransferase domain